jgi:hypothetical protein
MMIKEMKIKYVSPHAHTRTCMATLGMQHRTAQQHPSTNGEAPERLSIENSTTEMITRNARVRAPVSWGRANHDHASRGSLAQSVRAYGAECVSGEHRAKVSRPVISAVAREGVALPQPP